MQAIIASSGGVFDGATPLRPAMRVAGFFDHALAAATCVSKNAGCRACEGVHGLGKRRAWSSLRSTGLLCVSQEKHGMRVSIQVT